MYSAIRFLLVLIAAARAESPVARFTSGGLCDRLISIGIGLRSSTTPDRTANTIFGWSDTRRVSRRPVAPGQAFVMPSAIESVQQHCAMQRQWNNREVADPSYPMSERAKGLSSLRLPYA
jgi:hypothetical protein